MTKEVRNSNYRKSPHAFAASRRPAGCLQPYLAPPHLAAIEVAFRFGIGYLFSVVGTSRCDVRAACSGATPSIANVARMFVPPATTRAGTARRGIPTIALNRYSGFTGGCWKISICEMFHGQLGGRPLANPQ